MIASISTPSATISPIWIAITTGSTTSLAKVAPSTDQAAHRKCRGTAGGRPPAFDPVAYRDRHAVECTINALTHKRSVATRCDELAIRYAATVHVANIDRWLKRLS